MSLVDTLFQINNSVSMKQLLADSKEKLLQVGAIVEGTIREIYSDEARIDINAKSEGSLPIDELKDPDSNTIDYKKGDKILVYVLCTETKDGKILLSSSKAQVERMWFELEELNKNNESFEVKIVEANRGGLIGIFKGKIRGFIPLSQLSVHHRPKLKKGEEKDNNVQTQLQKLLNSHLTVRIIEVDAKRNRLILSERAAEVQNPNLINELSVGKHVEGKISNILKFGLFVDLGGFDGFVHISEVSWNRIKPDDLFTKFKIGERIKVVVIDIDDNGKRVSLSIKQLEPNPWIAVASKYHVGQIVNGRVTATAEFGLFIELEPSFEGLLHISDIKLEQNQKLSDVFKENDSIKVKIATIDTEKKRLGLTLPEKELPSFHKTEVKEVKSVEVVKEEPAEKPSPSSEEITPVVSSVAVSVDEEGKEDMVRQFSEIEGVGKTTAARLYEAGYKTLEALGKASISELSLVPGVRKSLADKIIKAAQQ